MVSDFVLVDLESQAHAVARYVKGWTRAEFLAWLSRFGELRTSAYLPDAYFFHSHFGLRASFLLPERGDLILAFAEFQHIELIAAGLFSS